MPVAYLLDSISHPTDLFCQYPGQSQPQAAYVTLDERGNVTADYSGEIGDGCSMHVWHGRDLQYRVAATVHALELVKWLQLDEARALLERIYAGHSVEWDGNNYVGRLTRDAADASDEFERALDWFGQDAGVPIWSAGEYIGDAHLSHLWPAGVTAQQAANDLESIALSDGIYVHDSMLQAMLDYAASFFDEDGDDCLTDAQIVELVAFDRVTQADADARAASKKVNAAE